MNKISGSITYGKDRIFFDVIFVSRKSMEIAVHPNGQVVMKAPPETDLQTIKEKVQKRARWIKRQLDYFGQFEPRTPPRQYVGGESHLYLGRQYRLKIDTGEANQVKLFRGYFRVVVNGNVNPEKVKELLNNWYAQKARIHFQDILIQCLSYFRRTGVKAPTLSIRRMKTRWGSLSPRGTLTLNVELIRAPRECIEYVVSHELCHFKHQQHDAAFYRLLEQHMPDWEKRKHKLELALV